MNTSSVQLLTAMLSLATLATAIVVVVSSIVARRRGPNEFVRALVAFRVPLIAIISAGAMIGSLYFSESAGYAPCTLCWYQRIPMYSIAVVAVVSLLRREIPTTTFVALAGVGAPISVYHVLLERYPDLDAGACSAAVPCTLVWFEEFGFVTLAFMALTAFLAILALALAPTIAGLSDRSLAGAALDPTPTSRASSVSGSISDSQPIEEHA